MAHQLAYDEPDMAVADVQQAVVVRVLTVEAITDSAFVAAWDQLAASASEPNAFNESWFLIPALSEFAKNGEAQIFTLWDGEGQGDCLIALMPLGDAHQYGRWPLAHSQNWLHPNAFLGTPLVRKGYERQFWQQLFAWLDGRGGSSIFAHVNGLDVDGPIRQALEEVCEQQNRIMALVHRQERALLIGDVEPATYYANAVRSKKRKELRRQKNRLAEMGELSFTRHSDATGLDSWIDEFLALERKGWKGANGSALDCAAETRNMFADALRGAAAAGKLERLDLRLDGRPLAMLVNFICKPGSFSFKTAFDEEYARYSPGVLLQLENLDLLTREGIDWCDSCAAEGHPMIDSLWTDRRTIGRYSVAIGGSVRRALFRLLLHAETARMARSKPA